MEPLICINGVKYKPKRKEDLVKPQWVASAEEGMRKRRC